MRRALRAINNGELDKLIIPEAPLDILAQQIVAMCAAEEWKERRSLPAACAARIPIAIFPRSSSTKS